MSTPLSSPAIPKTDLRRVGILFSGGPAPAANAVIASAAICFSRAGIEVLGLLNGYANLAKYDPAKGLKEGSDYIRLHHKDLEGVRTQTGILIGTSRENPGKNVKQESDLADENATAPLRRVYDGLRSLGVDAVISIGGDDTLTTAAKFKLFQDRNPQLGQRIRVVHLPKTIDNDYEGIDFTFGYFTAVEMLAREVRNLLADAQAARAWYVVQVMGRKAAWLTYGAAIAGEAQLAIGLEDLCQDWWTEEEAVSPQTGEVMRDPSGKAVMRKVIRVDKVVDRIVRMVRTRFAEGKPYGVVVIAEGLAEFLPADEIKKCIPEDQFRALKPDPFGHFPVSQLNFSARLGRLVAERVKQEMGKELKITGLQFGYEIRCHPATAYDICLGSQLGVGAYRALVEQGLDGVMVSVTGQLDLVYKPFETLMDMTKLRAKARLLQPGSAFHQLARYLETRVDEA
ncbi:MAG: 6-phosphofructokinase [Thermoguttaceae bacterium]|nr:6-phosphofructokinase [Thermoguttaceae bacterium]MDW8077971.1 6-phosphofructokinase [Thermoguttaceae bacterium]